MKTVTVPKDIFDTEVKNRKISIGMSARDLDNLLWGQAIVDAYKVSRSKGDRQNRNWHICRVSCCDENFKDTLCTCIMVRDGKVISITRHLPHQGQECKIEEVKK